MGIIRNGTAVSQLTFVPSDGVVMGGEPFVALAMRAQDRLVRLGTPAGLAPQKVRSRACNRVGESRAYPP